MEAELEFGKRASPGMERDVGRGPARPEDSSPDCLHMYHRASIHKAKKGTERQNQKNPQRTWWCCQQSSE